MNFFLKVPVQYRHIKLSHTHKKINLYTKVVKKCQQTLATEHFVTLTCERCYAK